MIGSITAPTAAATTAPGTETHNGHSVAHTPGRDGFQPASHHQSLESFGQSLTEPAIAMFTPYNDVYEILKRKALPMPRRSELMTPVVASSTPLASTTFDDPPDHNGDTMTPTPRTGPGSWPLIGNMGSLRGSEVTPTSVLERTPESQRLYGPLTTNAVTPVRSSYATLHEYEQATGTHAGGRSTSVLVNLGEESGGVGMQDKGDGHVQTSPQQADKASQHSSLDRPTMTQRQTRQRNRTILGAYDTISTDTSMLQELDRLMNIGEDDNTSGETDQDLQAGAGNKSREEANHVSKKGRDRKAASDTARRYLIGRITDIMRDDYSADNLENHSILLGKIFAEIQDFAGYMTFVEMTRGAGKFPEPPVLCDMPPRHYQNLQFLPEWYTMEQRAENLKRTATWLRPDYEREAKRRRLNEGDDFDDRDTEYEFNHFVDQGPDEGEPNDDRSIGNISGNCHGSATGPKDKSGQCQARHKRAMARLFYIAQIDPSERGG
ncbi:hypothetical protein IAU59_007571 [Kwoniella sp. CBS 9459]